MDSKEIDPLGEKPLFGDIFPQEKSIHTKYAEIKEEERLKRLAETRKVVPRRPEKFSGRSNGINSPIDNSIGMRDIIDRSNR